MHGRGSRSTALERGWGGGGDTRARRACWRCSESSEEALARQPSKAVARQRCVQRRTMLPATALTPPSICQASDAFAAGRGFALTVRAPCAVGLSTSTVERTTASARAPCQPLGRGDIGRHSRCCENDAPCLHATMQHRGCDGIKSPNSSVFPLPCLQEPLYKISIRCIDGNTGLWVGDTSCFV